MKTKRESLRWKAAMHGLWVYHDLGLRKKMGGCWVWCMVHFGASIVVTVTPSWEEDLRPAGHSNRLLLNPKYCNPSWCWRERRVQAMPGHDPGFMVRLFLLKYISNSQSCLTFSISLVLQFKFCWSDVDVLLICWYVTTLLLGSFRLICVFTSSLCLVY